MMMTAFGAADQGAPVFGQDVGEDAVGGGDLSEGLVAEFGAPFVQRFVVADGVGVAWRGTGRLQGTGSYCF